MPSELLKSCIAIELARELVKKQYPDAVLDNKYAIPVENTPLWDVVFMQDKTHYYSVRVEVL